MKQIILASSLIVAYVLATSADETYKKFLQLKNNALEAQDGYYRALTDCKLEALGEWTRGGVCVSTPTNSICDNINGVVTSITYYVVAKASVTNLNSITYHFRNGTVSTYRYSRDRQLSMIEDCGPARGDFRVYFAGKDGDLESYCTVTNFFAVHGVRHYKKGEMVSEDKGLIDFSIFK